MKGAISISSLFLWSSLKPIIQHNPPEASERLMHRLMTLCGHLFVNVSIRVKKDPKVVPCKASYICVQIADPFLSGITVLQINLVGWVCGGKCGLVWVAMMVVPDCRCSPFFPS